MASFPPVNSVMRAIDLLHALNMRPLSSIDELFGDTGIPKPSIVRLLQTFEVRGLVRRSPRRGYYCLTSAVRRLSNGYHREPKLIEIAAPLLDEMTRRVKWPLGIATLHADAVVMQYSTIHLSPLSPLHSTVGMRLSLASQAHGRAVLAFCENEKQDELIRILTQSPWPEDMPARDETSFRRLLADIRNLGVATRHAQVSSFSNTLAVPVFERGRVIASIGLTFRPSVMSATEAIEQFRQGLQKLATTIGLRLDQKPEEFGREAIMIPPQRIRLSGPARRNWASGRS